MASDNFNLNNNENHVSVQDIPEDVFNTLMGDTNDVTEIEDEVASEEDIANALEEETQVEKKQTATKSSRKEKVDSEKTKEQEAIKEVDENEEIEAILDKSDGAMSEEDVTQVSDFFKNKIKGLISKGVWFELEEEVIDNTVWDEDSYMNLAEQQAHWKSEEYIAQIKENAGNYKIIFDHLEQGGDPKQILNILKNSEEVFNLEPETESQKVALLEKYYVKELGWSEAKFKKFVENSIDDDVLDEEVVEVKSLLQKQFTKQIEEERKKHQEFLEQQQELKRNYENTIHETIDSLDLPVAEKKQIASDLLEYNQTLSDGRQVNNFTINFMKLQANPKLYVELVRFVNNPEKYLKHHEKKVVTETNKKTWNLIKGSGTLNKNAGGRQPAINSRKDKEDLVIDYQMYKK